MKPDFDISKCKDVAFARNMIQQMDEGYGRHNSNLAFRNYTGQRGVPIVHIREQAGDRIVGRFGDVHTGPKCCMVGDVFGFYVKPHAGRYFRFIHPTAVIPDLSPPEECTPFEYEIWIFEKVALEMTPDEGRTWNTEYFWKRIE